MEAIVSSEENEYNIKYLSKLGLIRTRGSSDCMFDFCKILLNSDVHSNL
jgi:hypothetical protein